MALSLHLLFLIFLSLLAPLASAAATDTISPARPLAGTEMLISSGGKFALGLFRPSNSSPGHYLAIWYHSISPLTSVWVANGASPLPNPATVEICIGADNNLALLDSSSKSLVWSTAANFSANSTIATLLDNGNLVLRDGSNSSLIFWQSFDHPTNTWLPGSKLGHNKTTGVSQRLICWKNSADPAPGIFSHELDPNGSSQYFIQWNDSVNYWSSGTWNGQIFNGIPEMIRNNIYNYEYVSNAKENYFIYSAKNVSTLWRFVMDISGQMKQLTWVDAAQEWLLFTSEPRAQCEVYALCGPFGICNENALPYCNCLKGFNKKSTSDWALGDQSGGCVRNTPLQCGSKFSGKMEKDKFYTMESVRLPVHGQSLGVDNASECELACLNNCSCTAYAYESSCCLWYENLINLQDQYDGNARGALYLRLAASDLSSHKSRKGLLIGLVVGGISVFVASIIIVVIVLRKHGRERSKAIGGNLVVFTYNELKRVTKNFSDKLGGGGFGSVFKGSLPNSTVIAVKKLYRPGFLQGEKQFRAEVGTIGTIQHINLINLIGFCAEGSRRLLVYEFMPNGSLAIQLFHTNPTMLSWNIRYQIALGIARGLAYLHEKCRDCIIHCDIKPENILLDVSFIPKVADFGLAKLLGRDFSRVLTTTRGTIGYLAPEWITGIPITAKVDVYSYGMMLFEIISGKRNSGLAEEGKSFFFPTLAMTKLIEGNLQSLLDPKLNGNANVEELERVCKVAGWCIQDDDSNRPTMAQVVQILEGFLEVNIPPMPIIIRVLEERPDNVNFFSRMSPIQCS